MNFLRKWFGSDPTAVYLGHVPPRPIPEPVKTKTTDENLYGGEMAGPFKVSFSWRAQLGAAVFMVGRQGVAGLATRIHLWGRPWTKEDPAYLWNADQWFQFAVKVVTLSVAVKEPRTGNMPIEPTSIEAALTAAFGPNPPDATFHLPQKPRPPTQQG